MDNSLPDKEYLYGRYQRTADWRDRLHRKLAHKSLDIGDDDEMQVTNANQSSVGMGWKELAVVAAATLGGIALWQNSTTPQVPTPNPISQPADSEYEVRFYDADGNLIDIPRIPRK